MKLTISQRIYAGFAIVIILMLTISATIWWKSANIKTIVEEIQRDDIPGVLLYLQVLDELSDMQASLFKYLTGKSEQAESFRENYKVFNEYFA